MIFDRKNQIERPSSRFNSECERHDTSFMSFRLVLEVVPPAEASTGIKRGLKVTFERAQPAWDERTEVGESFKRRFCICVRKMSLSTADSTATAKTTGPMSQSRHLTASDRGASSDM
jgi:hypothetical protein